MNERATAENLFLQDFAANAASLPGAGVPWLDARRAEAIKLVRANGIPHRRVEAWKYSDLRQALAAFGGGRPEEYYDRRDGAPLSGIVGPQVEFYAGKLQKRTSQEPGARGFTLWDGVETYDLGMMDADVPEWVAKHLGSVAQRHPDTMRGASLALMQGGLAIRVRRGVHPPVPFHLVFRDLYGDTGAGSHSRILIVVEELAELTLLETHEELTFSNLGVEVALERGARITHVRFAAASIGHPHVETVDVSVGAGASYRAHCFQAGSQLSRLEFAIELIGEGAETELSGASVLSGDMHCDITTYIDHVVGRTTSRQLFKLVSAGCAKAIYQGKVIVHEGASGSDSRQTAKALLLGTKAEADLKPELEILADDVKCAHGAAAGEIDTESMFYLRSRGIPEREARLMLIQGFLEEATGIIERNDIREGVSRLVDLHLARALKEPT
jgi:Fe-S cluster assembly protein SufD